MVWLQACGSKNRNLDRRSVRVERDGFAAGLRQMGEEFAAGRGARTPDRGGRLREGAERSEAPSGRRGCRTELRKCAPQGKNPRGDALVSDRRRFRLFGIQEWWARQGSNL